MNTLMKLTVDISFGVAEQETPRAANIRAKEERLAAVIEALNQDPDLQEFKQKFDANLDRKLFVQLIKTKQVVHGY